MKRTDKETDKFLLYIDILGFKEMSKKDPRKIERIFAIINSLNVHRHHAFKTVVFSDTILVYNVKTSVTDDNKNYLVCYLIEFAEDLHHRLTGQDVYFRAVITSGKFTHYQLENIECFFGDALVNAYLREKEIPSIGLFIDAKCNAYNQYFRIEPFEKDLYFVYLNRGLESLHEYSEGKFPIVDPTILSMGYCFEPWQVRFLKDIHHMMRTHPEAKVRTKFLTAWDFYKRRYCTMLETLEQNNFALSCLANAAHWAGEVKAMEEDIRHFKRIKSSISRRQIK
jgi:hypothetical protein